MSVKYGDRLKDAEVQFINRDLKQPYNTRIPEVTVSDMGIKLTVLRTNGINNNCHL
jgi:hypothetical protein